MTPSRRALSQSSADADPDERVTVGPDSEAIDRIILDLREDEDEPEVAEREVEGEEDEVEERAVASRRRQVIEDEDQRSLSRHSLQEAAHSPERLAAAPRIRDTDETHDLLDDGSRLRLVVDQSQKARSP